MSHDRHKQKHKQNQEVHAENLQHAGEDAVVAEPDPTEGAPDQGASRLRASDPATRALTDPDEAPTPDSGFFGAGYNEGEGDDNLARETTPGYQSDKGDRGTIMPG